MKYSKNIPVRAYLDAKGITYLKKGKELATACVFNGCDDDSRAGEAHLYLNEDTGQYDCKKCGERGNLHTLMQHFGDEFEVVVKARPRTATTKFSDELVEECHAALPDSIRTYLNERGMTDEVINAKKFGYGTFYGQSWITIPIKDVSGEFVYFKLRQNPTAGNNKGTFPAKSDGHEVSAQLYEWETLQNTESAIAICEGEFDSVLLTLKGLPTVSSTHGVGTFNEDWAQKIATRPKVYVCCDNDEAGRKGAERIAKMVHEAGATEVSIIRLPEEVGEGGDITDHFIKLGGTLEDLVGKYAHPYPERIDTKKFAPLTAEQLLTTLGLTIKHDDTNKLATFLCLLSAYTEDSQFNISFNAPSSTGKSYIPTEVAKLFPQDDVMEIAYSSPMAFFHDAGEFNKEKNQYMLDLSRKIIIFVDQPSNDLLARLRPLLSHDKKIIESKITDKSQKAGLRTKNIFIKGYPSVIFCTASLRIDEQEATRFLMLSPEVKEDKLREGIIATIQRESNSGNYKNKLAENPDREALKERIRAIKLEGITDINIASPERIEAVFAGGKRLKPRHQRDAKRLAALAKAFALVNLWFRERNGSVITANDEDVAMAVALWEEMSVSQELNLPPYVYDLYTDIIMPLWREKSESLESAFNEPTLERSDILKKHFVVYGRMMSPTQLRQTILPMLETAGLIMQEPDPNDKRQMLIKVIFFGDGKPLETEVAESEESEPEGDA